MTSTPARVDRLAGLLSDDKRWYVIGDQRYLRVTTALDFVGESDGLIRWAAGLAADAAVDVLPKLLRATRMRACGNTYHQCKHDFGVRCASCPCRKCLPCVRLWIANRHYAEKERRAGEGTAVHDVVEYWVLHDGDLPVYDPAIAPYVRQFLAWVADYGLTPQSWEMTEATVVNRTHGYAGTLDAIVTVVGDATPRAASLVAQILGLPVSQVAGRSVQLIADAKSREKEEARLFAEMALQQVAYRRAEVVRLRDGAEVAMPVTDGAVILQVRPDGYLCRPVVTDDATFGAFLAGLHIALWHLGSATASVSSRSFPVPKEPKPAPKPRAAKAAAKEATGAPAKRARKTVPARPVENVDLPVLRDVAATQSATLASLRRATGEPHPDSPFGDSIPF